MAAAPSQTSQIVLILSLNCKFSLFSYHTRQRQNSTVGEQGLLQQSEIAALNYRASVLKGEKKKDKMKGSKGIGNWKKFVSPFLCFYLFGLRFPFPFPSLAFGFVVGTWHHTSIYLPRSLSFWTPRSQLFFFFFFFLSNFRRLRASY